MRASVCCAGLHKFLRKSTGEPRRRRVFSNLQSFPVVVRVVRRCVFRVVFQAVKIQPPEKPEDIGKKRSPFRWKIDENLKWWKNYRSLTFSRFLWLFLAGHLLPLAFPLDNSTYRPSSFGGCQGRRVLFLLLRH